MLECKEVTNKSDFEQVALSWIIEWIQSEVGKDRIFGLMKEREQIRENSFLCFLNDEIMRVNVDLKIGNLGAFCAVWGSWSSLTSRNSDFDWFWIEDPWIRPELSDLTNQVLSGAVEFSESIWLKWSQIRKVSNIEIELIEQQMPIMMLFIDILWQATNNNINSRTAWIFLGKIQEQLFNCWLVSKQEADNSHLLEHIEKKLYTQWLTNTSSAVQECLKDLAWTDDSEVIRECCKRLLNQSELLKIADSIWIDLNSLQKILNRVASMSLESKSQSDWLVFNIKDNEFTKLVKSVLWRLGAISSNSEDSDNINNLQKELFSLWHNYSGKLNEMLSLRFIAWNREIFDNFRNNLCDLYRRKWDEVVYILRKTHKIDFTFLPQDLDWKADNWKMTIKTLKRMFETVLWPVMLEMIRNELPGKSLEWLSILDALHWLKDNWHLQSVPFWRLYRSLRAIYILRDLCPDWNSGSDKIDWWFFDHNKWRLDKAVLEWLITTEARHPLYLLGSVPEFIWQARRSISISKPLWSWIIQKDDKIQILREEGVSDIDYLFRVFGWISQYNRFPDRITERQISHAVALWLPLVVNNYQWVEQMIFDTRSELSASMNQFRLNSSINDIYNFQLAINDITWLVFNKLIHSKWFAKVMLYLSRYWILRFMFAPYSDLVWKRQQGCKFYEHDETLFRLKQLDELRSNPFIADMLWQQDCSDLKIAMFALKFHDVFIEKAQKAGVNLDLETTDSIRFLVSNRRVFFSSISAWGINLEAVDMSNNIFFERFLEVIAWNEHLVWKLFVMNLVSDIAKQPDYYAKWFESTNKWKVILQLYGKYKYLDIVKSIFELEPFWDDLAVRLREETGRNQGEVNLLLTSFMAESGRMHSLMLEALSKNDFDISEMNLNEFELTHQIVNNIDIGLFVNCLKIAELDQSKKSAFILANNTEEATLPEAELYLRVPSRESLRRLACFVASKDLSFWQIIFLPNSNSSYLLCKVTIHWINNLVDVYGLSDVMARFCTNEWWEGRNQIAEKQINTKIFPWIQSLEVFIDQNKWFIELAWENTLWILLRLFYFFERKRLVLKWLNASVDWWTFHNVFYFENLSWDDALKQEIQQLLLNPFRI